VAGRKRRPDGSKLADWPPSALDAGVVDAILAAGKLDGLTRDRRQRLRSDLQRAATVLRSYLAAEKRSLPSIVQRDLLRTASGARRLHARLNDLDPDATRAERQARFQVLGLLAEALAKRSTALATHDQKISASAPPGEELASRLAWQEVTQAVGLIAELAAAAGGLLEKSKARPKHEKRTADRKVVSMLGEAWVRATRKPLATKPNGPSGRFVRAFFGEIANVKLSPDQTRRLLRSPRRAKEE
jgi:hypothetical protein